MAPKKKQRKNNGGNMLELKNVSKFYYGKDTVASGFTKMNLKLNMGEFVVITGESGSGKSTLLNVLSGLDTYEEGEMYINGEETSGYSETDFENYRKKYIGNIFQSFNLVNSYTVYQNIELVLLINGYKKSEVKNKILEVIKKVDLFKYRNTKVSKLSGGQKQRVAIARALVKDTPILVADEPTGNLDSKSAENIMKLLHEVSKDKLMILVTHNYEQVEKYATRKITMHDGRMIEDKVIVLENEEKEIKNIQLSKPMRFRNKIRLGIRNTFNILPKFLLLILVYLVLCLAALGGYSSLKKQEYEQSKLGDNYYFRDTSDKRIVIKKKDESMIQKEDYETIKTLSNIDKVIENDLLLDQTAFASGDKYGFTVRIQDRNVISLKEPNLGRMPLNENEAMIKIDKNYFPSDQIEENVFNKDFILRNMSNWLEIFENKLKIVGIIFEEEKTSYADPILYVSTNQIDEVRKSMNTGNSTLEVEFNGHIIKINGRYRVLPNKRVPKGKVYAYEGLNQIAKNNNCKNKDIIIKVENRYYKDTKTLKVDKTYNKRNIKQLLNLDEASIYQLTFYLNPEDYYSLFDKENYQSSVFVKDEQKVQETIQELDKLGYQTLYIKDTLINPLGEMNVITNAITMVVTVIVIVALFFLSYFIIKMILKSRNVYYTTIRILGATRKNAKQLLKIELLTVLNIVYIFLVLGSTLIQNGILEQEFIDSLLRYVNIIDYVVLYVALVFISLLISNRYARQLFKKSVMNTYREEV